MVAQDEDAESVARAKRELDIPDPDEGVAKATLKRLGVEDAEVDESQDESK